MLSSSELTSPGPHLDNTSVTTRCSYFENPIDTGNLYPVHPMWIDNSPRQPTWPPCTHCIPDSDAVPDHWALKFNALFSPASISTSHLSGASLGLTVFPYVAGVSPPIFQRRAIMLSEGNKNG